MDAYVSVPVRMVFAKTDVKILPAVSLHAACSSYQADIILAACRKEQCYRTLTYRSHALAIIRWLVVHACTFMNIYVTLRSIYWRRANLGYMVIMLVLTNPVLSLQLGILRGGMVRDCVGEVYKPGTGKFNADVCLCCSAHTSGCNVDGFGAMAMYRVLLPLLP